MIYDYTVLAGTQGYYGHKKSDRLLKLIYEQRLPLISFVEGGGGRPGDVDHPEIVGLNCTTFAEMARLSGRVPTVGVASGYCFAGNAALLGCHDAVIATRDACIGMAGPAMIEGGGLGVFHPSEIGPVSVQHANGVIDILVETEADAVVAAKRYISYFQGAVKDWECRDQRSLRHRVPENRMRSYEVRSIIDDLADCGSVMELRSGYAVGIVTALIRMEGMPVGVIANNTAHLGGAIDSPAADKAARFIQLCNAHDLPLLSLIDTPGFMVGPEAERDAQVRRFSRLFVSAANADIPSVAVILRKAYGLGAQAMAMGGLHEPLATISWPSGELGGMGLEGAVRLGFRKELEAETEPEAREVLYRSLLAQAYEHGKAERMASVLEFDAVVDPAETRDWVLRAFRSVAPIAPRAIDKQPFIDPW